MVNLNKTITCQLDVYTVNDVDIYVGYRPVNGSLFQDMGYLIWRVLYKANKEKDKVYNLKQIVRNPYVDWEIPSNKKVSYEGYKNLLDRIIFNIKEVLDVEDDTYHYIDIPFEDILDYNQIYYFGLDSIYNLKYSLSKVRNLFPKYPGWRTYFTTENKTKRWVSVQNNCCEVQLRTIEPTIALSYIITSKMSDNTDPELVRYLKNKGDWRNAKIETTLEARSWMRELTRWHKKFSNKLYKRDCPDPPEPKLMERFGIKYFNLNIV